jgi:lipoyl(octanoyl) transferase
VSYHGIALNVDPDLHAFDLIDPCGMPGTLSTSIAAELGRPEAVPSTTAVHRAGACFARAFAAAIAADLEWIDAAVLAPALEAPPPLAVGAPG